MSRIWPSALLLAVLPAGLAVPLSARANDRHFSYTYEAAVLAPGDKELEVWTTYRNGRDTGTPASTSGWSSSSVWFPGCRPRST
jgi:hypothetical protein